MRHRLPWDGVLGRPDLHHATDLAFPHVRHAAAVATIHVIAGRLGWNYGDFLEGVRASRVRERVRLLTEVDDESLPALISASDAFVFPSLYEGFGLPVLEAMACGVPVITSTVSSLPEAAGDAALLVDPTDVGAIASAIRRVVSSPKLAGRLSASGLERARQFSWARCARETFAVYQEALDQSGQMTDAGRRLR